MKNGGGVDGAFLGAVRSIKLCPKPIVAAVHGDCRYAGCEMALAADFRLASTTAAFCEDWIHLGVVPPLGGMYLLPQLVGLQKATEMIMLGDDVPAEVPPSPPPLPCQQGLLPTLPLNI